MAEENTNSNLYNETPKKSDLEDKKLSDESDEAENKSSSTSINSTGKEPSTKTTEDPKTDQVVDEIVRGESDEIMKIEDDKKLKASKLSWYKKILADKRLWIPLAIVLVLILVLAVPVTRYKTLGLFLKQTYKVELVDSQTAQPVSAASVTIAGKTAQTNNQGKANIKIKLGQTTLIISKKYYKNFSQKVTVGLKSGKVHNYELQATGRQVTLTIVNKISAVPVANAEVDAAGTTAKSNSKGIVNVVLPADKSTIAATISDGGFNNATATIQIANGKVSNSTFQLAPAGRIYFLSDATGTIDVVSTNLDGTNRQTVLAGSGDENPNNTSLLASRDWKYLALQSKRTTTQNVNSMFLINTSNNKLTTMDTGNASFTPIGWSGHYFVYEVDKSATVQDWQSGQEVLKSYNADNGTITVLDQTSAQGTASADWLGQTFGSAYIVNNQVLYTVGWSASFDDFDQLSSKQATLSIVNAAGGNKTALQSFSVSSGCQVAQVLLSTELYEPDALYIQDECGNLYKYDNGQVSSISNPTGTEFGQVYPTFLLSPSGNQAFWGEPRDGKTSLFVGDQNGNSGKQIAALSDYTPYGWYTDSYLLVEKNGSELYIMPTNGSSALKISDYYKPAQNFNGYGGGYGGQ